MAPARIIEEGPGETLPPVFEHRLQRAARERGARYSSRPQITPMPAMLADTSSSTVVAISGIAPVRRGIAVA